MGVDRNDPKTFINAGPPSQNLKAGIARSTGDDGSIYREIGKSGEGEGLPSFVASSPETKCLVKLKWEPRTRDIAMSKPWSRFRWASVDAVADRVRLGNRIRTYLPRHIKSPRSRCAYFELLPSARLSYPPPQAYSLNHAVAKGMNCVV